MASPTRWNWTEVWSFLRQTDEETQRVIAQMIGFEINPATQEPTIYAPLHNYLMDTSVDELADFLAGAPLPIAQTYLHYLPEPKAKKVWMQFRASDSKRLEAAYKHPRQIVIDAPARRS